MKLPIYLLTTSLALLLAVKTDAQTMKPDSLSDTSVFIAKVNDEASLYPRTSLASDPLKQFDGDQYVAVVSYVEDAVDYLLVIDNATQGYVPVSDLEMDEAKLAYLKSRGREGEAARLTNARYTAKHINVLRLQEKAAQLKALEVYTKKGLLLTEWSFTEPDDVVGGVDVSFQLVNPVKKKIKYAWFTVVAYNAVGDRVSDRIRRNQAATLKGVGPLDQWDSATWSFEHVWYNQTIDCVKITQIKVQYMDGSIRLFDKPNLVLAESVSNSCKY